ncbi:hypothetical protein SCP_0302770 [Sparassis crispa]|uniref:Uncharacterized protein n=1 Tax=Sparassis crispa TaxID=139825 RepID=A0A401GEF4_9APHY|nr:hypothetical protein SCP_0302770 [Sparassis crispa]GBE80562.1 hypothetical protein SCP_0302770 [Sparassis crispa]
MDRWLIATVQFAARMKAYIAGSFSTVPEAIASATTSIKPLTRLVGDSSAKIFIIALNYTTPRPGLYLLLRSEDKGPADWESWRDGLVRRWNNLNIVCGLIIGAVSTLLFSNYPFGPSAFAFGITSLLSSLICIGFGVGLIYVLGDVHGSTLRMIGHRYPKLYLAALSIPQVWGGVSFSAFFVNTCIIGFEAKNKGPVLIMGITLVIFLLVVHLAGFMYLFGRDLEEDSLPEPNPSSSVGATGSSTSTSNTNFPNNSIESIPTTLLKS